VSQLPEGLLRVRSTEWDYLSISLNTGSRYAYIERKTEVLQDIGKDHGGMQEA